MDRRGIMFTLWNWIGFGIVLLITLPIGYLIVTDATFNTWKESDKKRKIITLVVEIILMVGLIVGCGVYNTHTESGKRNLKSWDSNTSGGLNRTVTVYDMQGEEVAKYQGKFDVEESQSNGVVKIKFDINGKRHIIYAQTGTVLIDEN